MIINFSNIGSGSGGGSGYTLPIATETRLGGVKVGSGLNIDPSTGVLSASGGTGSQVSVTQVLSAGTKIATVSVDGVGTDLFAPEGSGYTLPIATKTILGGVKVGSGLTIDPSTGVLSASGGTGSQVSVTQELSAGTKIATVTVDGVGTDLFAPEGGGSSEQNYQIVSNINEVVDKQEGTRVYVKSGSSLNIWEGISFDASQVSEGYVGNIYRNSNEIWRIYRSGSDFYWDWNNDGNLNYRKNENEECWYQCDTQNGIFNIFLRDFEGITVTLGGNATSASTSTGITETWKSKSYIWLNNGYREVKKATVIVDNMSTSERADFYNYLLNYTGTSLSMEDILEEYDIYFYVGNYVLVKPYRVTYSNNEFTFISNYINREQSAQGVYNYVSFIKLNSSGQLTENSDEYCAVLSIRAQGTAHTLSFNDNIYDGYFERMSWGNSPVSLKLTEEGISTTNTSIIQKGLGQGGAYLYATWVNGNDEKWEAKWDLAKNQTPIYFRQITS